MQAHYLSTRIQNEFIDICGSHVQTAILHEIVKAKYFSIIVDATPDCSYKEQTTLVIRYVKLLDNSNFSVEKRFILFDNFSKKTGREIAARTLEILKTLKLDFEACIGQAYDNGANMAGKYNGVQAVLIQQNPNCMFSSCENHSLNLVGVDCAESCKEAVTYFGTIQQMYNLFSSSPQRWEILKQHLPVSLHGMSKTRWSARIDGVKPVAQHLNSVRSALNELGVLHLTAQAKMELDAIQKYISKFDCILMSSIWMKLLTMIHQTNLIIEARQATLDIEKDNIENLCNDIQRLREQFDKILNESKFVARNIGVSCEFLTNHHFPSQDDAELYFKINVYFVIIDSIQSGLTRRFQSLQEVCKLFEFLWQFKNLNDEDLVLAAQHFQHKYDKEISQELENEVLLLKRIYGANFKLDCTPKKLLEEILGLGLLGVFPHITIALRIFISLPASTASGERTFNVLKQIKNYHRSTMGQERLNGLAMLNINCDIARKLDFSNIIAAFSEQKARKAFVKIN